MDTLIDFASTVPTWVWVVSGVIVFMLITGERILWKFETHFPMKTGVGRGQIKLAYGKKRGARIRYRFELDEKYRGRKLDIFLNTKLIHSIPAERTKAPKLFRIEKIDLDEAREGAEVEVYSDREKLFEDVLVIG